MIRARTLANLALAGALLTAASCSPPKKKPADDQVSHYFSDQLPPYLSVRAITTDYESITKLGESKLPDGSWKIIARMTLRTAEDLYAVTPEAKQQHKDFERAVFGAEKMRTARIQAVEAFAQKLGLLKDKQLGPMPAFSLAIANHQGDEIADRVTLLAQPDGSNWKFAQLDAQSLDTTKLGEPLATLRRENPSLNLVVAGSPEEKDFSTRQAQFLSGLARMPPN